VMSWSSLTVEQRKWPLKTRRWRFKSFPVTYQKKKEEMIVLEVFECAPTLGLADYRRP
jgi:hypothetical protein